MTVQAASCVRVQRSGGVAVLSIDDGKANAINTPMLAELGAALQETACRGEAVVLAGRRGRFCAGYDMAEMLSGSSAAIQLMNAGADLLLGLLAHPRPVVAACTGHAIAGGAVILLACDSRLGLDGPFKVGLNEVSIGLPLPSLATTLAHERLDPRHFLAATLGATIYDPRGAVDVGYLDRLVAGDVVAAATEEAARLAALPADAYRLTKESARRELLERLRAARRRDVELVASLLGG